jgi:hypothetical protein
MSTATLNLPAQQRAALEAVAQDEADAARLYARRVRHRAEVDRLWNTTEDMYGVLELAGTARIGQTRASSQLVDATRLVEVFPHTLAGLDTGTVYVATAELLLSLTRHCTSEVQTEVERRVLPHLNDGTTTDLRRLLERTIPEVEADVDPQLTQDRLDRALRERRVWMNPAPDAMCQVGALLGAVAGQSWALAFEELVRAQKALDRRTGRKRSTSQVRADVFAELPARLITVIRAIQQGRTTELLELAQADPELAEQLEALADTTTDVTTDSPADVTTNSPAEVPADVSAEVPVEVRAEPTFDEVAAAVLALPVQTFPIVNVHLAMTTALELDHRTGYVEGLGPVPAQHARLLLPVAPLRRIYVDDRTGVPHDADPDLHPPPDDATAERTRARLLSLLGAAGLNDRAEPQHDPSAHLIRQVRLRDPRCTGIGCATPAHRSELDHQTRYPEGPTAVWNLNPKSSRCHHAKHHGWTTTHHPDGSTTWQSPLGHAYTRPGVWQQPLELPDRLVLPPPLLHQPDDHDPHPLERDLWPGAKEPPPKDTDRP